MGTFHQNKGELHGITVVVDTTGPEIVVGRCDDMDDRGIFLHEADVHRDGDGGRSKEDYVRRVSSLPGRWHLLVLSEDWCGDAVNTVPIVARLVERCPNVDMRVLARDVNPDLMDAHLTGGSRSIPVIIVLDEAYEERAWWGPRPTALQRWVSGQGQLLEKTARYREARTWYARDRGRTTLDEVVSMLERAASTGVAAG